MTSHFQAAEYFKGALSPLQEMKHRREWRAGGFCLRLSHRSGAETGAPEMWRRLLGSKAVGGSFSPQLRPRLATSSLYNFREQNNFFHTQWEFTPSPSSSFYIFISPPRTRYSSHLQTAVGASRTAQQTAAWPHKDRHPPLALHDTESGSLCSLCHASPAPKRPCTVSRVDVCPRNSTPPGQDCPRATRTPRRMT